LNVEYAPLAFDSHSTAWKFTGGWAFNENFALEASFVDGGTVKQHYGEDFSISVKPNVIQASAIGTYWFNEYVNLYGRVGAAHWDSEGFVSDGVTTLSASDSGTDLGVGAGLGAVWDNALFRVEYEQFDADGVDARLVSVSIAWRL
jgi:OmpA-OmpF porin, OOP family